VVASEERGCGHCDECRRRVDCYLDDRRLYAIDAANATGGNDAANELPSVVVDVIVGFSSRGKSYPGEASFR
jgi:hypothetical protein